MSNELIKKMAGEGWIQQFSASGDKLEEAIDNYTWLGFEVRTIPVKDLGCDGCTVCFGDENDDSAMIFTRKVRAGQDDELFSGND